MWELESTELFSRVQWKGAKCNHTWSEARRSAWKGVGVDNFEQLHCTVQCVQMVRIKKKPVHVLQFYFFFFFSLAWFFGFCEYILSWETSSSVSGHPWTPCWRFLFNVYASSINYWHLSSFINNTVPYYFNILFLFHLNFWCGHSEVLPNVSHAL